MIVSIPDLCILTYFYQLINKMSFKCWRFDRYEDFNESSISKNILLTYSLVYHLQISCMKNNGSRMYKKFDRMYKKFEYVVFLLKL